MSRILVRLAAMGILLLHAGDAGAQCSFGGGSPAYGSMKTRGSAIYRMVRAYASCPGPEHPSTNAETEYAEDSCTPVLPVETAGASTEYNYAPEGGCSLKLVSKLVKDCSILRDELGEPLALAAGPCHDVYLKGTCTKVEDGGGLPIGMSVDGWKLVLQIRVTTDDAVSHDMTVTDYPLEFPYSIPVAGGMKIKGHIATALAYQYNTTEAKLSPCTSSEVVNATILDPLGHVFARPGVATSPD